MPDREPPMGSPEWMEKRQASVKAQIEEQLSATHPQLTREQRSAVARTMAEFRVRTGRS